ncbi:hypothetical protein A4T39_19780 [Enterobacter hormaechei]|nr:hypothetical protein B1023_07575 [Enterobacter hormaechei]AVE74346.1 hypothetical protein AM439_18875 [Enterobacter cloacae complex sp.]AXO50823.1 hypothetical protein AXA52_13940 [Enterobacter hormaechei]ORD23878.1 hypothetical protein A4T39_19780 [Enterobacter hormaechei]RAY91170.1 hypothetical protein DP196_12845 [Enterobacter hormaechei subsp. steigerwaltii]
MGGFHSLQNRYFVTPARRMNHSGVISPTIACCMVKKGTKKDAFYPKKIYRRHDASPSPAVASHRAGAGINMV